MIHVSRSGAQLGVFEEDKVREGLRTGEFIGTDLGWMEGMATWRPLSELESFRTPAAPPPVAAPAPETTPTAPQPIAVSTPVVGEQSGLPWENRERIGFLNALWETILMILTKPNEAFGVMRREGNFVDPLLYVVLMGTAAAVVSFFYSFILNSFGMMSGGDRQGVAALFGFGAGSVVMLILMPVILIIGMFVGAAITHVCLMIVGGANQSYETTLRVLSYSSGSANILQLLPVCGGMVAGIYTVVLNCIGLARAHQTDTWRAVVAVLLPVVVCCGGAFLIVFAVIGGAAASNWH